MDSLFNNAFKVFTVRRTNVYIHQSFLFLVLLVMLRSPSQVMQNTSWVAAIIISLLVHEFGHVIAARVFGLRSDVVLWAFGGLTMAGGSLSGWRSIVLSLAGPAAGFLFWAPLWFGMMPEFPASLGWRSDLTQIWFPHQFRPDNGWQILWQDLCFLNLFWGCVNLLPIHPLDGGQAFFELLRFRLRMLQATRISGWIGVVVAAAAAWTFMDQVFIVVMFLIMAWMNLNRARTAA